jgi:hypothetical protein
MFFQTDGSTGWFFLSGAGLFFTGAARAFKESQTGTVHSIGAYTCIISAFLGLGVEKDLWYLPVCFILIAGVIYSLNYITNKTWWVEIVAFTFIFCGLLL